MTDHIVTAILFLMLCPLGLYVFFKISRKLDQMLLNSQLKSAKKHIADYEAAIRSYNFCSEDEIVEKVKRFSDGIYATIYKG